MPGTRPDSEGVTLTHTHTLVIPDVLPLRSAIFPMRLKDNDYFLRGVGLKSPFSCVVTVGETTNCMSQGISNRRSLITVVAEMITEFIRFEPEICICKQN